MYIRIQRYIQKFIQRYKNRKYNNIDVQLIKDVNVTI